MLCSLVDGHQCFRGSRYLRLLGRSGDCVFLEGRGSKYFQNIGTCVMDYMTSHPTSQCLNWSGCTENIKILRDKFTLWREIGIIPASMSCDQIHRSELCPYGTASLNYNSMPRSVLNWEIYIELLLQSAVSAAYENICIRIGSVLLILLLALILCRLNGDCAEFKINLKSFMT